MFILAKVVAIIVLLYGAEAKDINYLTNKPIAVGPERADAAKWFAYSGTFIMLAMCVVFLIQTYVDPETRNPAIDKPFFFKDKKKINVLNRVLRSIDPVESAFAAIQTEEDACKQVIVCELHRAASLFPFVDNLLRYIRPYILGLDKYKEAQRAGTSLKDCSSAFVGCPHSVL